MRPEHIPLLLLYALTAAFPILFIATAYLWIRHSGNGKTMCLSGLSGGAFVVGLIWVVGVLSSTPLYGGAAAWVGFFCAGFSLFSLIGGIILVILRRV